MPRPSRRAEIASAALEVFSRKGFEGASVADIADAVGVTKAAVAYHFPAKTDIARTLAEPLLAEMEALDRAGDFDPSQYASVLERHAGVARWLDWDRSAWEIAEVGGRLEAHLERMRVLIAGDQFAEASMVLGMLWRPLRFSEALINHPEDAVQLVETVIQAISDH